MTVFSADDVLFMQQALNAATVAASHNEVPVGAVLVHHRKIIAVTHNEPIRQHDPCAHAEILALRQGAKALGNYRLTDCTLYVTLEPCCMCAGAIAQSRVSRLVYGAFDQKAGCVSSKLQLLNQSFLNHHTNYIGGLLEEESLTLLRHFFKARRKAPIPSTHEI